MQYQAGKVFAKSPDLSTKTTWNDLSTKVKDKAIDDVIAACKDLGLGDNVKAMAEWKLWQLHRGAVRTDIRRESKKDSGINQIIG